MPHSIRHHVDGELLSGSRTLEKLDPADGTVSAIVPVGDASIVDRAVAAAKRAVRGPWRRLSIEDRVAVLSKVAPILERRAPELVAAEVADTGKPIRLLQHFDVPRAIDNFRYFASIARHVSSETFLGTGPNGSIATHIGVRVPRGVIGVITPWNMPLVMASWKLAPALAWGNSVVFKPSELTPRSACILAEVFAEAGLPEGVFNVVHGDGSTGELVVRHPDVNALSFVGSIDTGVAVMQGAAVGVRPVSLELGGKNAAIVFADADLDAAAKIVARAIFTHSGQMCLHVERVYVERTALDGFIAALSQEARTYKPGPPADPTTTFGPIVSFEQRDKVLARYRAAREAGATVVTGGDALAMPGALAKGAWLQPTLWTGLPHDAAVLREEIFGPCAHVSAFDGEEEAIAVANDTRYGLAAVLFTKDIGRAHRVALELEAGTIWVNGWMIRDPRVAIGGSKQSGIGREGGVHGADFYSELRNICINVPTR